jgi:hypothetical protein
MVKALGIEGKVYAGIFTDSAGENLRRDGAKALQ